LLIERILEFILKTRDAAVDVNGSGSFHRGEDRLRRVCKVEVDDIRHETLDNRALRRLVVGYAYDASRGTLKFT